MTLNNLKIGTRLLLGFGVVILIGIVSNLINSHSISTVEVTAKQVKEFNFPYALLAEEMAFNAVQVQQFLTDVSATHDTGGYKDAEEAAKGFKEGIERFKKFYQQKNDAKTVKELEELETQFNRYYEEGKQMAQAYTAQGVEAGNKIMENFDKTSEALAEKVRGFKKRQVDEANETLQNLSGRLDHTKIVLWLLAGCVIILSLAISIFITRSITRPLFVVMSTLAEVAGGDLTVRASVTTKDEMGQLADEVNRMAENVCATMVQVVQSSAQVASAASHLYSTSEQMATGAEEVAAQAGTVATAGEEMAATSAEIAQNCNMAADGARQANDSAVTGAAVVQETVSVMSRIAERVKESAHTVGSLGDRSDQIGAIIGTIEDIADQTNLLALNAAIEAARAGEQGRGFAVVADEVRALAERTTKATREIGEMIKAIQQETKGAVAAMEEGVNAVEKGTVEASKSGQALQEILNQINEVTMQINQVATAAEEQTATTDEISNSIQQITEVVQETSSGAHQSADAASRMVSIAEELQRLVGQFKLAA
ncbi:MAG: methyl-accepting chemotaxis [Geobacteraceae bacterium]|nr:MAG: methyl-accepting chemotaxis [Geobacteraceae bacterium]